jgi:hypothetical protein
MAHPEHRQHHVSIGAVAPAPTPVNALVLRLRLC